MHTAQHKKLYQNALSTGQSVQSLEKALNSVLRLAIGDHFHFNFLLHNINWFSEPYLSHISILEKALRIYRGRGKQSEKVVYNLLADGMWSSASWRKACECLINLIKNGFDQKILKQSIRQNYPHKITELQVQQNYLSALLYIIQKCEKLRFGILQIIMLQLASFDTELCTENIIPNLLFSSDNERKRVNSKLLFNNQTIKFDTLVTFLLQELIRLNGNGSQRKIQQQLLLIFKNDLLVIGQTNFIQFLIYYFMEGKKQSKEFVAFLMGQILQKIENHSNNRKILVVLSNYLASYVTRSVNLSFSYISKTVSNLIKIIDKRVKQKCQTKKIVADKQNRFQAPNASKPPEYVNLSQIYQDNFDILLLLQTVIWIWTMRKQCREQNSTQFNKLLQNCRQTCYFSYFINQQLLLENKLIQQIGYIQQSKCIQISHKFNPPFLKKLSFYIQPLLHPYDKHNDKNLLKIQQIKSQQIKLQQSLGLGMPTKRVKSQKKQSEETCGSNV